MELGLHFYMICYENSFTRRKVIYILYNQITKDNGNFLLVIFYVAYTELSVHLDGLNRERKKEYRVDLEEVNEKFLNYILHFRYLWLTAYKLFLPPAIYEWDLSLLGSINRQG